MQRKTLRALSEEYDESAALQQAIIDANRDRLRQAQDHGRKNEAYKIKRYLRLLYAQKQELIRTAVLLRNYYRFSGENKPQEETGGETNGTVSGN